VKKLQGIETCVVVVETHVSDKKKAEVFSRFNVRVWDIRTIHFILCKAMLIRRLSLTGKPPKEAQLDTVTSVIYGTKGRNTKLLFRCFLFYQNPLVKLDSQRFRFVMGALTTRIGELIQGLPVSAFVSATLFSLPGVSVDLVDNAKQIVNANSHGRITYDPFPDPFGFDTASWRFVISPSVH